MYTGIVQQACELVSVEKKSNISSISIRLGKALMDDLVVGASVGVDGVCLTVTALQDDCVEFDVMLATLELTTLGACKAGDWVNVERSAKQGVEVGGHILSGHVDIQARIVNIQAAENLQVVTYSVPAEKLRYIFDKGFIALNGCSLTVLAVNRDAATFCVSFIPETLRVTTHGAKGVGDHVNVEIDRQTQVIVDTVTRLIQERGTDLGLPS